MPNFGDIGGSTRLMLGKRTEPEELVVESLEVRLRVQTFGPMVPREMYAPAARLTAVGDVLAKEIRIVTLGDLYEEASDMMYSLLWRGL